MMSQSTASQCPDDADTRVDRGTDNESAVNELSIPNPTQSGVGSYIPEGIELAQRSSKASAAAAALAPAMDDDEPQRGKFRVLAIFIALSLSLFIAALDQTIVATVIPTISSDLHSAAGYIWIGGAYMLANAAAANIWANLSDIWGRKPILLMAIAVFFFSSIICATATDIASLIVGRAFQGAAGGGLIQLVTITISDLFSVRRRSLFMGLLEFMWALASAVGPIMGGALTQAASWRWIYWINLPICGTTFLLLLLFLDVHNPRTAFMDGIRAVDWFGSLAILGLTLMLLLGLDFGGETFSWSSAQVICLIIFGCCMSAVFIYCEGYLAKYPLMPLRIFRETSNVACFVVAFSHGMVFLGGDYYLPLYFQSAKGASPLRSGILTLPIMFTESIVSLSAGLLIHRTGRYLEIIRVGMAGTCLGTGLYINFDTESSLTKIILFQIAAGLGTGTLFFPPLLALQANVSQADTASATATYGFIRNLATAASIVVGGVVFQNSMTLRRPVLLAAGLSANETDRLAGTAAVANVLRIKDIPDPLHRKAVRDAFSWSLRNMWILYTGLAFVGVVASLFIRKRHLSKEHTETKTGLREKTTPPNRETPSGLTP